MDYIVQQEVSLHQTYHGINASGIAFTRQVVKQWTTNSRPNFAHILLQQAHWL